jgi:UDP-N-acetylmuramyl tripeptide synthase
MDTLQEANMSRFLVTDDNPDGYKLEDILSAIRNEMFERATKIMDDRRPEAVAVMNNNIKILNHLAESITLAENSTAILVKAFGQHDPNVPRIGKA